MNYEPAECTTHIRTHTHHRKWEKKENGSRLGQHFFHIIFDCNQFRFKATFFVLFFFSFDSSWGGPYKSRMWKCTRAGATIHMWQIQNSSQPNLKQNDDNADDVELTYQSHRCRVCIQVHPTLMWSENMSDSERHSMIHNSEFTYGPGPHTIIIIMYYENEVDFITTHSQFTAAHAPHTHTRSVLTLPISIQLKLDVVAVLVSDAVGFSFRAHIIM